MKNLFNNIMQLSLVLTLIVITSYVTAVSFMSERYSAALFSAIITLFFIGSIVSIIKSK